MTELLTISTAHTLVLALVSLVLVRLALMLLDRATGRSFAQTLEVMHANPLALSIYYGCRFIGACLLVGLAIG